ATITFEPLVPGERVLKFALLPTLRVTRVSGEGGQDLHFIQENRKEDGSFYAVLDEAPSMGQAHAITVEYGGDKVLSNAGSGSYYIGARQSWYPNLNGFGEKALYDLTFKVPPSNVLISVGKLEGVRTEAGFSVTHWVTPVPVAVAGFNYGKYMKMDYPDSITHYEIAGYFLTELPDRLRPYENGALRGMSPSSMTKYALDQARAQMQVCTLYFGKAPYENIYITEQPNFNFGQSWPNLVYLPISAYIDSTQRWMLFGQINSRFTGFVQEVTPHEVAHQWFGHGVGWASYHDQWLSEGFAEFAAGLFLQQAMGPKWQKDYIDFRERHRDIPASTESFKAVAEKHMTKKMDLQQNGRLDWFFREWVWGTQVPRYNFKYDVQPAEGGKFKVHAEITQNEVDENFAMFVPIFADFGDGMVRLSQVPIAGNSTRTINFVLDRKPKKVALNAYKEILER